MLILWQLYQPLLQSCCMIPWLSNWGKMWPEKFTELLRLMKYKTMEFLKPKLLKAGGVPGETHLPSPYTAPCSSPISPHERPEGSNSPFPPQDAFLLTHLFTHVGDSSSTCFPAPRLIAKVFCNTWEGRVCMRQGMAVWGCALWCSLRHLHVPSKGGGGWPKPQQHGFSRARWGWGTRLRRSWS